MVTKKTAKKRKREHYRHKATSVCFFIKVFWVFNFGHL
jgi:hypothetical protein